MTEDSGRIPHLFVHDNFHRERELARKSSYQHVALESFALAIIHYIHLFLKISTEQF